MRDQNQKFKWKNQNRKYKLNYKNTEKVLLELKKNTFC